MNEEKTSKASFIFIFFFSLYSFAYLLFFFVGKNSSTHNHIQHIIVVYRVVNIIRQPATKTWEPQQRYLKIRIKKRIDKDKHERFEPKLSYLVE